MHPEVKKYFETISKQGGEALKKKVEGTDYYKKIQAKGLKVRLANAKKRKKNNNEQPQLEPKVSSGDNPDGAST